MQNANNYFHMRGELLAQCPSIMSDSDGSILYESDLSDGERPVVKSSSSHLQVDKKLQALVEKPCRCSVNVCFSQFAHCAGAVQAERVRFRELSYTDQVVGGPKLLELLNVICNSSVGLTTPLYFGLGSQLCFFHV